MPALRRKVSWTFIRATLFHTTIANFGSIDDDVPNHQKFDEVGKAPQDMIYIKEELSSYTVGANAIKSDSSVNAVQNKHTRSSGKIADHETLKKKDKEVLNKTGENTFSYLPRLMSTDWTFRKCSKNIKA